MTNLQYFVSFIEDPELQLHVSAFLLGMIRILMFASIVPVFGPNVSTPIKISIILALYIPLHPYLVSIVEPMHIKTTMDIINLVLIVAKEVFIGYLLGWLVSLTFYISLSAGTIVDNQRGASMAQGAEVYTGGETSPLGNVLFMSVITLFFSTGAFLLMIEMFYSTFFFWPPNELIPGLSSINLAMFSIDNLSWMMEKTLLVAIPFVLVALSSDISLGLVNRFAPQLNVFILSMSIKSAICSFLVIFYFNPFLENSTILFGHISAVFTQLKIMFGLS